MGRKVTLRLPLQEAILETVYYVIICRLHIATFTGQVPAKWIHQFYDFEMPNTLYPARKIHYC